MLKFTRYDKVTRIDSARSFAGQGYYWTTAYWVDGLLVDTGCAHTAKALVSALNNENLTCILNTHTHEDHIGANGILQAQHNGLKIFAHPFALPILKDPRSTQPLQLYRRVFWGWPTPSIGQPIADGMVIEMEKFRFQVIYTPGHSPDHICLYEAERGWLFTGDLFVGGRDRALRLDCNIWQIIASLRRVAALPLTRLFPGCARVRDHPQAELAGKIAYLEEKGEQVLALHHQGLGVDAVAQALFGKSMWIEYVTLGHFTRRRLVQSYLSEKQV